MTLPPSDEPVSDYFQWPAGVRLQIQCADFPRALCRELGAFRCSKESDKAADARIIFCKKAAEMSAAGQVVYGRYKGLPWKIVITRVGDGLLTYFFYAPAFRVFLFVRTCLIPILKKVMIEKGGFFIIGSAFAVQDTAFIIFGRPGSGKTRLLLDRLDAGGKFLGDSELMLTAEKKIFPAVPYIEARFKTLYGTSHWARLSFKHKVYLGLCHVLSGITLGRISFNLLLGSADNPWMTPAPSAAPSLNRWTVLQLRQDVAGVGPLSPRDFLESVADYEMSYQRAFGEDIYSAELRELGLSQLKRLLAGASVWGSSEGRTAHDFLQREMTR